MNFPPKELTGPFKGTLLHGTHFSRNHREFGIYDPAGGALRYSDVWSEQLRTEFARVPVQVPATHLVKEPCVFCGLVSEQFGHVLLNSLGRLWALSVLPEDITLVFTSKRSGNVRQYPYLRPVLDAFGIKSSFRIIVEPTSFEALYIPSDQFGERYDGKGSDSFYSWVDENSPLVPTLESHKKIYVSRSGLGASSGRYACEQQIEELLVADGYEVYHPEQHDLNHQFKTYKTAEKLIFAEGSALHAFALVRRPEQEVAVIRRRLGLPKMMQSQLNDRASKDALEVDAIKTTFWPPKRSDHLSVSVMDFRSIGSQLFKYGFISSIADWNDPPDELVMKSLNAGLTEGQTMQNHRQRRRFLRGMRHERWQRHTAAQSLNAESKNDNDA